MSAAGMGADSPPPMHFPALPSGEERDYRADDEDEFDEEVDNSFDYIPAVNSTGASVCSEDFAGDEATKADSAEPQEDATHVPKSPLVSEGDEEEKEKDSSPAAVEKVEVEQHIETTVVEEGSHAVAATDEGQVNELMAVTPSPSYVVIDRETSSTLGAAEAEGLADGSSGCELTSGDGTPRPSNLLDTAEESKVESEVEKLHNESDGMIDEDEEKPAAKFPPTSENDEVVSETPQSGDAAREADDERSDAPEQQQEQEHEQPLGDNAARAPAPLKDQEPLPDPSVEPNKSSTPTLKTKKMANKSTKSRKRKQRDPQSGDKGDADGHLKTVAATAQSTVKKPKKSRASAETGASGNAEPSPLRRSSRIKMGAPKFTYPVKLLPDEAVMNHFRRHSASGASPPATPSMTCKYCGTTVTASRGLGARHLMSCEPFGRHEQTASKLAEVDESEEKPAVPLSPAAAEAPHVKTEAALNHNSAESIVQLMGSEALAKKLKGAFQHSVFAGHGPISRFQELIRDDVTGLRHLRVQDLLDAVDTKLDGPIVQLRVKQPGAQRSTGQDVLEPVSKAKAHNLEKLPLRFPAPRSVAEHFIVPLAAELGLGYAMDGHKAHLVSCPQGGTLLDWRFHRTETVVFQLGGKSLWKLKMGHVEHPLHCFHPDSWLLEATAHVAKAHRVASMDKDALGFLGPPGDDLHVFDVNGSGEQEEYMLKPGSVAYVPAGAWFEVETQGPNSMWLEVQLASMTCQDLVFSALKQLAWGDKQWRMGLQLYPGDRNRTRSVRHHVRACIESLHGASEELEMTDLLPEYLCTEDMPDLASLGLLHNLKRSPTCTSFEVDLTNPRLKLKHEKIFKDASYRVNPVAVLVSADEIPHIRTDEGEEEAAAGDDQPSHHALKRTPKPKPKRKQTLRVITHNCKHTYILDEIFGNEALKSQLHVQFQCSADQSRVVEWLRGRGAEPFKLEEVIRCDSTLHESTSPAQREENARHVLRFLCFVGYITQLKRQVDQSGHGVRIVC
ncbi:hypothetical protein PR001_g13298 [Phytophthora rubi]|uniref:JmjC domain-containing protein n=1 Tax=Phytophthora rubi TaxID=129364 RepID=A0A6A3LU82_9STRA|nr:hypothetical protein PR001_g13298 [Phytophthora rubi]